MGLLDMFKKKSEDKPSVTGTSLNDLPPIPQNPIPAQSSDSTPLDASSNMEGLPPSPGSDPFPESTLSSDTSTIASDTTSDNSLPFDPDLEIPEGAELNPEPLAEVDELPSVALDGQLTANPPIKDSTADVETQDVASDKVPQNKQPAFTADISTDDMSVNVEENPEAKQLVEEAPSELQAQDETLPSFQDLQDDISMQRTGTQLGTDSSTSVDIKTESLLLKSIFVEKEHYANILFSLKRVKDDLQKSGPQQRKLAHVDMKLAKEYSKLSTLFENTNENLMVIEHIVSNDQF